MLRGDTVTKLFTKLDHGLAISQSLTYDQLYKLCISPSKGVGVILWMMKRSKN